MPKWSLWPSKEHANRAGIVDDSGQVLLDPDSGEAIQLDLDGPSGSDVPTLRGAVTSLQATVGGLTSRIESLEAEKRQLEQERTSAQDAVRRDRSGRIAGHAQSLADSMVSAHQIAPNQKAFFVQTYTSLANGDVAADRDPAAADSDAAKYAASCRGVSASSAAVRSTRPSFAASGGGDAPEERSLGGNLSNGTDPEDPLAAAGVDDKSMEALLRLTPEGRATLARVKKGEVSMNDLFGEFRDELKRA